MLAARWTGCAGKRECTARGSHLGCRLAVNTVENVAVAASEATYCAGGRHSGFMATGSSPMFRPETDIARSRWAALSL